MTETTDEPVQDSAKNLRTQTARDHAEELRNMHCTLLAGGADWSDVLLDAAVTMEQWQAALGVARDALEHILFNRSTRRVHQALETIDEVLPR